MPFVTIDGVRLSYHRAGTGDPVLLIMGSGAAGHVWTLHQTSALHQAGYQTIVFDNRGIGGSDAPAGAYTLEELTSDTRGLIERLEIGPCHVVGISMGAMIAQELAIASPKLIRSAVLLATRARTDRARGALHTAERALRETGVVLPAEYQAVRTVLEMLSPATLNDDETVGSWLEIFELSGGNKSAAGQAWVDVPGDRRPLLREITVPCLAVAFADDLICPPHLVAEVADAIPDCDFIELPNAGHLGNLEQPEAVNTVIVEFLDKH